MMPFRNNCQQGDEVVDVVLNRKGVVAMTPRERSTKTAVRFGGNVTAVYVGVARLRLLVNGQPETVPPCDGELPPDSTLDDDPKPNDHKSIALDAVKTERAKIKAELAVIEADFKKLKAIDERLAETERILSAP